MTLSDDTAARLVANDAPEDLWDVRRTARYLGMSKSWVYEQVESGSIPHIKLGSRVKFDPAAVRRWATGQSSEPARVVALTKR